MIFAVYKLVCFLQPVTDIPEAAPCMLLGDSCAGMHFLHQIDVVAPDIAAALKIITQLEKKKEQISGILFF
jgi:hypothetical protein